MTDKTNGVNLIPVADVTAEAEWAAVHKQAAENVIEALATARPFAFVDLAEDAPRVSVLADRQGMEYAVFSLMATLGDELLGASVDNLPQELANNLKLVTAMTHLQRLLQAMTQPQTPAGDAKKPVH